MARRGKIKRKLGKREQIKRPVRVRRYQYLFLIVCEDEKTEPAYFEQFKQQIPEKTIYLKSVGTGRDAKGVVTEAIKEKEKLEQEAKKEVDVVWVVFDKDDADENETKIKKFEEAFEIAAKQQFKIAYSNEVFEVWLLLHLVELDAQQAIPRKEIYTMLEEHIQTHQGHEDFVYLHGKTDILEKIKLLGNERKAIARASYLLKQHTDKQPIEANPSTLVHLLVEELREWIVYYSFGSK